MASVGAPAVLGPDVTTNPGTSITSFMALPFPPPTTGPTHQPAWEQHLRPPTAPSFLPGQPLVLPALSVTPLVAGNADPDPTGTGACNILFQVRSEDLQPQPPQMKTLVLTQAPPNWSAPGALSGGSAWPAPVFLEASAVEAVIPSSAFGGTQASEGGWCASLPPPPVPPAGQLAHIVPTMNAGPQPHGAPRDGGLATSQSKASSDDSCNPSSVYENFRRWQHFKALAQRHQPQSPDSEALSCFLIPVLRSLSRLKPTMTLEEGMWRAVQEWERKSNFDRMVYYEMAEKFMEFEAEEKEMQFKETQFQKTQLMQGAQGLPPPAPPRPDPQGLPAPVVGPQPAPISRKAVPKAQRTRRHQQPQETDTPNEIPPEAVQEYMDIMDDLLGPAHSAPGEPGEEWEEDRKESQQEADLYPNPDLLSFLNQLCSQNDFVTKVEAVIHPQFLAYVLSPEIQLDILDLTEDLKQEEGLTPAQLVKKRLLASKEEAGVQAPLSHYAAQVDSSPSETAAGQDAQRCDLSPQPGVCDKACPPDTDFKDHQRHGGADAHLSRPKALAISSGPQEYPPLRAHWPSTHQSHGRTYSGLGPRDASISKKTSLLRETREPVDRSSKDEEDLPSLSFLLGSTNSLLPCGLSLSPVPASGWGPRGTSQSQFIQTLGLSQAAPAASKSRKRVLSEDPAYADRTLLPGTDPRVSDKPALALGLVPSSPPQKRKCDLAITERCSKWYYSQ